MSARDTQEGEPDALATSVKEPLLDDPLDEQRGENETSPGLDIFRSSIHRQAEDIHTAMNMDFTATGEGPATHSHEPLTLTNRASGPYLAVLNADALHAHGGRLCHGQSSMILADGDAEAEAGASTHPGACPVHSGLMDCPFHPPDRGVPETVLHGTLSEHSVQHTRPNPADHYCWDLGAVCDNSDSVAQEAAQFPFLPQARRLDCRAAGPPVAGLGGQFKPRKLAAVYQKELSIHGEDDVEGVAGVDVNVDVDVVPVSRPQKPRPHLS
jgi:hypothetical protein